MRAWTWWLALALAAARARELDPAACAARFDVQRDKIIRTEESREMGARYLAELDVGARAECLRLCCETDACDVFVFEEKSPGSCYLFKCGPPEDFRCKFTAHGNFSSGVLALSRHLAELQDQERLAHHERELAGLRQANTNSVATSSAAPGPVRAPPPPPPAPPSLQLQPQRDQQRQAAPPSPPPPPQSPSATVTDGVHVRGGAGRCSRYQFECRRGGECIAVYNACDGVPQCADGSDEAPELGCPAPAAPAPRPPQEVQLLQPHAQVAQGAEREREAGETSAEGGAGGAGELWPRRLAQAQRRFPGLTGGAGGAGAAGSAPHIFSHQGGLLQPAALAPAWPHRPWPPDQRNEVDNMEGTGGTGGAGGAGGWGYARLEPWPDERRAWPVPPRAEPELPVYVAAKTMPELPLYPEQQQQVALRDAPKKGFELQAVAGAATAPPAAPAPPPPLPVESTTKKKALKDTQEQERERARGAAESAGAARGAGAGGGVGRGGRQLQREQQPE